MSKLRSVNTKFWEDPWVEALIPKDKLLFLYLLTNSKTNMLGIYEVSIAKICFETGLTKDEVGKALKGFERVDKVYYEENYVILPNFLKNQSLNTNMKKSALSEFEKLPMQLKNKLSCNASEGFESLSKGFEMLRKEEVEDESEDEDILSLEETFAGEREIYLEFGKTYFELLREKGKIKKTQKVTKAWVDNVRLMVDVDGVDFEEVRAVAKAYFKNFDHQYISQCYSTASFREKYISLKSALVRIRENA